MTPGAGWTCPPLPVGGAGTQTCTNPSVPVGTSTITLVLNVSAATPNGTIITNTASVSAPDDAVTANNSATATTTTVSTGADLVVLKSDSPDPVAVGGDITYSLTVRNDGPQAAASVTLSDVIPANTTFVSIMPAAGWTCPPLPVGGTGTHACTMTTFAPFTSASFTLIVKVNLGTLSGTMITNTAAVSSATTDPNFANNTASTTTVVGTAAELCARPAAINGTNQSDTLSGTPGDIICGGNGCDTINGRGGNDVIFGQNGKDVLNGDDGNDSLVGGNGKDRVTGGPGIDALRGGNGADSLNAQDGAPGDSIFGGLGPDTCPADTGDLTEGCP